MGNSRRLALQRFETGNSQVEQIDFLFNLHVVGRAVRSPPIRLLKKSRLFG